MKEEMALSMSTAFISLETEIATAAAISEALNSKKSIPAFNSHQALHQTPLILKEQYKDHKTTQMVKEKTSDCAQYELC